MMRMKRKMKMRMKRSRKSKEEIQFYETCSFNKEYPVSSQISQTKMEFHYRHIDRPSTPQEYQEAESILDVFLVARIQT